MLNYTLLEDDVLLNKLYVNKDERAFDTLYKRYFILIYGLCLRRTNDVLLVEDLVMDTFVDFYKAAITGKVQHVDKWLHSVAINNCVTFLIKRKIEASFMEMEQNRMRQEEDVFIENAGFLKLYEQEQDPQLLQSYLNAALGEMKEEHRVCLNLFYLKDMSYREIANHTQYNLSSVKSYIQNGKRNLSIILREKMAHLF